MSSVDYSKYSITELFDVKNNISPDSANYSDFMREMESRADEIQQFNKTHEAKSFSLAKRKVKIVGYVQLAAAVIIALAVGITLINEFNLFTLVVGIPIIVLNAFAGYTAIKEQANWYWLSILNQALQVIGFSIGTIAAKYSGLGFIGISLESTTDIRFSFGFEFAPGFSFYKYAETVSQQWVSG